MSRLIKVIWSLTSLAPLFLVLTLVFLSDYIWNKSIPFSLWLTLIMGGIMIILCVCCYLIIRFGVIKLETIKFSIEEIESKDGTVASGMITYLLPLITITFTDVNWVAFLGLILVMLLLLISTRIVLLNPLLYFGGYKYYSIKAKSGVKYTLITRKNKFNVSEKKIMVEIFDDIYIEVEDKDDA